MPNRWLLTAAVPLAPLAMMDVGDEISGGAKGLRSTTSGGGDRIGAMDTGKDGDTSRRCDMSLRLERSHEDDSPQKKQHTQKTTQAEGCREGKMKCCLHVVVVNVNRTVGGAAHVASGGLDSPNPEEKALESAFLQQYGYGGNVRFARIRLIFCLHHDTCSRSRSR